MTTMLAIGFLIILLTTGKSTKGFVLIDENEDVNNITRCTTGILKKYFTHKTITMVSMNSTNVAEEIIKSTNNMLHVSIVVRDTSVKSTAPNVQYFVTTSSTKNFIQEFSRLSKEKTWYPEGKFLIVIKQLKKEDLVDIFNKLLDARVINALVLNGTKSVDLYAYNPYENYGCGKSFERIISYGRCLFPSEFDLYPNKLVTGLRNCTFRASVRHLPPFTVDPRKSKNGLVGMEQYAFNIVSELEGFKVDYSFDEYGETLSTVDEDNVAHGALRRLQMKEVDILFGFMLLTSARSKAFDYLYGHLAYTDEFNYFVQRAGPVSAWRNLYLEFTMTVWLLTLASFISYAILMTMLIRGQDRVIIVFKMLDAFVLHGSTIRSRFMVKVIYLTWIWFAYLMSSIYQCTLFGLTTHPNKNYQVKNLEDLKSYHYKACTGVIVNEFMKLEAGITVDQHYECLQESEAALYVSDHQGLYTIDTFLTYSYARYRYFDATGKSKLFRFEKAINKIIYAIYLYKGFPMHHRLNVHTLRLRENGLLVYYFDRLYHEQNKKYPAIKESKGKPVYDVFIPWSLLSVGVAISTAAFILEILSKKIVLRQFKRK